MFSGLSKETVPWNGLIDLFFDVLNEARQDETVDFPYVDFARSISC